MFDDVQSEFTFSDAPSLATRLPHPLEGFFAEVASAWGVPLGENVCVRLRDPAMPELTGRLELARAPDLPLDPRQPLELHLCGVYFSHRDLSAWTLKEPSS